MTPIVLLLLGGLAAELSVFLLGRLAIRQHRARQLQEETARFRECQTVAFFLRFVPVTAHEELEDWPHDDDQRPPATLPARGPLKE